MATGRVLLHMPLKMAAGDGSGLPPFYTHLSAALVACGGQVEVRHRDLPALERVAPGPDFHFVHNGRIARPGVLNTGLAYVYPYWYVDPAGIFGDSSVVDATFDAALMPADAADAFFRRLHRRHVKTRTSRYPQDTAVAHFPRGCIAIFLQDISDPVERTRHMKARDMLRAVLADTGGRTVVVKPHPRTRGAETDQILSWLARRHPGVIVTEANLHDILAASSLCVSIGSSVALEGMMHRVPAILFGRSDLHHCAETVQTAAGWTAARDAALRRDFPYAAFLWWFLQQRMIGSGQADMVVRILDRMTRQGADLAVLGLSVPLVAKGR